MYWFSLIETSLCGLWGFGYALKLRNDLRLKPSTIKLSKNKLFQQIGLALWIEDFVTAHLKPLWHKSA